MRRIGKCALFGLGLLAVFSIGEQAVLRRRYLRWGATKEEVERKWPGDELVARPGRATRAITIHAPAERVWPWIMQIGQDRGGFYSYSWLENLFMADIHNVDHLLPDVKDRAVGESVWMTPQHRYGGRGRMKVAQIVPNRAMVLVMPDDFEAVMRGERARQGEWQFLLEPVDAGTTRLIMRGAPPDEPGLLYRLTFDPAHFIMERKMMLGIKERAEGAAGLGGQRR
jgi:hypothetical protein